MNLILALSTLMAGCATHSRYEVSSYDGEPAKARFFPTTQRAYGHNLGVEDTFSDISYSGEPIVDGFIILGGIVYLFAVTVGAIATDIVLAPVDAFAIRKEHQQTEELLKQAEERAVEASLAGKAPPYNPKRVNKGSERKFLLLAQCRGRRATCSMALPIPQLEEILRESSGPAICLPEACTCGKPIDPIEAAKHVQRTDQGMRVKTSTHAWDGIAFCLNNCECGQHMVVWFPLQIRSLKCDCGREFLEWKPTGEGLCPQCQ